MWFKRLLLASVVVLSLYYSYNAFVKRTRILTKELQASFVDLGDDAKKIRFPGRFVKALNPGVVKFGDGYLMVFRAKYVSFFDFIIKNITGRCKNAIGLCRLNSDLEVVSEPIFLNGSAPAVSVSKQNPTDPRLIEFQGRFYAFYNEVAFVDGVGYGRKMYMCEVFPDHFGVPQILNFPDTDAFAVKGNKLQHVEKNWTPFIYQGDIYFIYLIEPQVILKLDIDSGICRLVQENPTEKIWDFGIARGGTPCVQDGEDYLTFFHSIYPVTCLGHSHNNAYIMGACWFSGQPPFEIIKKTQKPLSSPTFYTGSKKIIFPSALIDEGDHFLLFYGRDDSGVWALKISKDKIRAIAND